LATTEKVKGVQFNYVNFLWKEISWVEEKQKEGNFALGLQALIDLLYTVPKDIYEQFKDQMERIQREMAWLRVKVRQDAIDQFNLFVLEPKVLNRYAARELPVFIRAVCNVLDKRGYMEKTSPEVPEGRNY
jgi:hypothetical protein